MKDKNINDKVIWLIDENETELRTFQRELAERLGGNAKVEAILPYSKMQDYVKKVLSDDKTVAIIIDQKLKNTGTAHYAGIELAEYLRGINPKLPIYILTNYPEDINSDEEVNVEYILAKSDFKDNVKANRNVARMLRHIDTYTDILSKRGQRFKQLLEKSMKHKLARDEYDELEQLKYIRLSPVLASELEKAQKLERTISANQKLLAQLKGKKKHGR